MTTHSSILAWKIQWTEQPDRLQSEIHKESDSIEHTQAHTRISILITLECIFWKPDGFPGPSSS